MSARYHVNNEGAPGICRAQPGNCPVGRVKDDEYEQIHYESKFEAALAYEEKMSGAYSSSMSGVKGGIIEPPKKEFLPIPDKNDAKRELLKLATNTQIPEILKTLSTDESVAVRKSVARNEHTPPEVLEELSEDEFDIAQVVVDNPNVSFATRKAANDRLYAPRGVNGTHVSGQVLIDAAFSSNVDTRYSIARSPNAPAALLHDMRNDKSPLVQKGVASNDRTNPSTLEDLATSDNKQVRLAVAKNKRTNSHTLRVLGKDKDSQVREHVALHDSAWSTELEDLSNDANDNVRRALATKDLKSYSVKMSKDPSAQVRLAVAQNYHSTPEALGNLVGITEHPTIKEAAVNHHRYDGPTKPSSPKE